MTNAVSRRRLITGGVAAGLLAASGTQGFAATRTGGLLRLGLSGVRRGWDPRGVQDSFSQVAGAGTVFDCLTEIGADGTLRGELATGWRAEDGARTWVFDLRQGVSFHDGSRFGAQDVIASLELHRNTGSDAARIVAQISGIEETADARLRISLHGPNPDLPILLADPRLIILPAHAIGTAMEQGIGTGLYRVGRMTEAGFTAWRVDGHYKGEGAGQFTEVELVSMPDAQARIAALLARKVHAIDAPDDTVLPEPLAQATGRGFGPVPHIVWHGDQVSGPRTIGGVWPMDNARIAERWWRV